MKSQSRSKFYFKKLISKDPVGALETIATIASMMEVGAIGSRVSTSIALLEECAKQLGVYMDENEIEELN